MPPPQNKQPDFIPAGPDFIPAQQDDTVSAPPEQPGLLESMLPRALMHPIQASQEMMAEQKAHPIRSAFENAPGASLVEGAYNGAKRIGGELKDAYTAGTSGLPHAGNAALSHLASAIPFVGPAMDEMGQQTPLAKPDDSYMSQVGDVFKSPGAMGTGIAAAAQMAPFALGVADEAAPGRALTGQIPTRARAGKVFESVMQDAKDQPVTLTRSRPILDRAMQLSDTGHGTIGPLDKMFARVNQTQPLDYAEARDRASALSSLTGEDQMRATPSLKGQAKQFSHAFNQDVGDAAASVGRGKDYTKAMTDYRRASQLNHALKTAGKYAAGAAATGAVGAGGYKLAKDLLQ